jgi:uncharacterized membrane protein YfcA
MEILNYTIAVLGGFVAGCINILAGFGSIITLSILMELLGLPGNLANGTNRVNIMAAGITGTYSFYKGGKLDFKRSLVFFIPALIGAMIGVYVALQVSNEQFKEVFKYLLVIIFIIILINPKRWLRPSSEKIPPKNLWLIIPLFLALGFYGGFIQMGAGLIFIAILVLLAKKELIEANAIKVFVVAGYTVVVLFIFHLKGLVDWKSGAFLAIGQATGAWLTARFASHYKRANVIAYRLLIAIVILVIARTFGVFDYFIALFK